MARHRRVIVAVAVALVSVVTVGPALASAPAGQPSPTPTPAPSTPDANATDSAFTNGSGAPNGWGPFKSGDEYAADLAEGAVNWTVAQIETGISGFVSLFNHIVYALPAPGSPDDPMSWQDPQNRWWPAVWATYLTLAPVGFWLVGLGYLRLADAPQEQRRAQLRQSTHALLAILFGFLVAPLGLHMGNVLALGLAPSGTEFMSTPGNAAKLGLGILFGAVLVLIKGVIVLVGLLVLFLQYFVTHLVVAFWPLFWGFRATPFDGLRAIGHAGVAAWLVLIVLKVVQSGILRLMFEIPWAPASEPGSAILALVGTAMGLGFTTILLPKIALSKMIPAAVLMMGTRRAGGAARNVPSGRDVYHRSRERYRERFGGGMSDRSSGSGGDSGSGSTRTIGSVQQRTASYSRPGGRPGAATRSVQRRHEQTQRTGYNDTHGYD